MRFDSTKCGMRIKDLRNRKNMTQMQLSDRLNISYRYLSRIENGISVASVELLIEMADYFGVTLDYLLMGKENKNNGLKQQLKNAIEILEAVQSAV